MIPQPFFFYFLGQMDTNELINRLPETVKIRARHVFAAVLDYIFDTLTMDLVLRLPPDLTYKVPEVRNKNQFNINCSSIVFIKYILFTTLSKNLSRNST